jgi:hypothetical protein
MLARVKVILALLEYFNERLCRIVSIDYIEVVFVLSRHVFGHEIGKSLQTGVILPGRVRRILAVGCRDDVLGVFEAGGF